ncbi:hypothetical protein BC835DRAFT_1412654 [Cytidiella melzeri]|nr:hypothetical protein BC835DRAFT_1412654 [Cytidiella melzeri]
MWFPTSFVLLAAVVTSGFHMVAGSAIPTGKGLDEPSKLINGARPTEPQTFAGFYQLKNFLPEADQLKAAGIPKNPPPPSEGSGAKKD